MLFQLDSDLSNDRMASEKLLPDSITKKSSSSIFGTRNNLFLKQICEETSEADESQCSSMNRNHRFSKPSLSSSDFVGKTTPPSKPPWKRSLACNRSGSDTSDCDDVSSSSLGHHHRRRERRSVHRSTSLTSHGGHNRFPNDPKQGHHANHHHRNHPNVRQEPNSPPSNTGGSDPSALHSHLWSTFTSRKLEMEEGTDLPQKPKFFLHEDDFVNHQQGDEKKQQDSNNSNVISKTLRRGSAAVIGTVKKSMSLILGRPSIVSDSNLQKENNESKTSCWGSCSDLLPSSSCSKTKSSHHNHHQQPNMRFLNDHKLLSLTNEIRLGKAEVLKEFVDCESHRKGARSSSLVVHIRSKDFSALVDKFGGAESPETNDGDEGASEHLNSNARTADDNEDSENLDVKMYCCPQKSKCCSVV